ncbi:trypsin-like serine protease [SAR202 cluster bacterium AD-802-E10_MRT_200m]|nr:trypsin-like serine protease [SAR202 cluster bacterium AD-802-E10_MRT_200m]
MRLNPHVWIISAVLTVSLMACGENAFTPEELYGDYDSSVVLIETDEGFGTGIVIREGQYNLTAAHVVEGSQIVTVRHASRRATTARVFSGNEDSDVALLKVTGTISLKKYPALANTFPSVGSSVTVIGYPMHPHPPSSLSQGVVSKVLPIGGWRHIELDAAVNPGNSGGPLFSEEREIIGMVVRGIIDQQGLNYAISSVDIITELEQMIENPAYAAKKPTPSPSVYSPPTATPRPRAIATPTPTPWLGTGGAHIYFGATDQPESRT